MAQPGNANNHDAGHGSVKSYVIGFLLSIVLTVIPIVIVLNDMMGRTATIAVIMGMGVLQLFVQLFFFMHIRQEEKPRYNAMALILAGVMVFTVVAGSIWIMSFNHVVQVIK